MSIEESFEREADHGPKASGWSPGDFDANNETVHFESDASQPGVAPEPEKVVMGGIIVEVGSRLHFKMLMAGVNEDEDQSYQLNMGPHSSEMQ